jgi:cellobiose PTS system EIIB component
MERDKMKISNKLHILLLCNLGASTGILVSTMRDIVSKSEKLRDKDIKIEARPAGELNEYISNFDVLLLGPQIGHRFDELKEIADSYQKPLEIINTKDYGTMNGANILKQAILMDSQRNN